MFLFPFENLAARYISRGHDGANATEWLLNSRQFA
jgi:hypothetical protein